MTSSYLNQKKKIPPFTQANELRRKEIEYINYKVSYGKNLESPVCMP